MPYNSNSAPTLGSLPPRDHEVRIAPVFSSSSLVFFYTPPLPPYFPPCPFPFFALTLLPSSQMFPLLYFLPSILCFHLSCVGKSPPLCSHPKHKLNLQSSFEHHGLMLPGGQGTAGRPLDVLFSLLSEMLIGAGIPAPTESGLSAWRWQTAKTGPSWELLREYDSLSVSQLYCIKHPVRSKSCTLCCEKTGKTPTVLAQHTRDTDLETSK